jgi:leader peptidase (prepilin peptidase)/N-methyltransferase
MTIIAILCLTTAALLLIALSWIDLKVRLLPNKLVLPLALLAPLFHYATAFSYLSPLHIIIGGIGGYAILYTVRAVANYSYKQDALGLGDVKLMAAGGLWLGFDMLMIALVVGSAASLLHGFAYGLYQAQRTKTKLNLNKLQIPAGPGFAFGLVVSAYLLFNHISL